MEEIEAGATLQVEQTGATLGASRTSDRPVLRYALCGGETSPPVDPAAVLARLAVPNAAAGGARPPRAALIAIVDALLAACGSRTHRFLPPSLPLERQCTFAIAHEDEATATACVALAGRIVADPHGVPADAARTVIQAGLARGLDPNARLLMEAARARDLPVMALDRPPFAERAPDDPVPHGLFQIGQGCHRVRFLGAAPEGLPGTAREHPTLRVPLLETLARAGLRVPVHAPVPLLASAPERCVDAARAIGFPVMLRPAVSAPFSWARPALAEHGPLAEPAALERLLAAMGPAEPPFVVEQAPAGRRHRLLIVDGDVIAASVDEPPSIEGDGAASVRALVDAAARAAGKAGTPAARHPITVEDADVSLRLAAEGLTPDTVLERGRRVSIRARGTPYAGGAVADGTETVGRAARHLALRAAAALDLDRLAGVDLAIPERGTPTVLDVVPFPDLLGHEQPTRGRGRDAADRLLETLFPPGAGARVPIAAITGTNGKTTTAFVLAAILGHAGRRVGLASTTGGQVDGERIFEFQGSGLFGAANILADPRTEAAVLETARGSLAHDGLAFERCDVAACLNVATDHLGEFGIETTQDMAVHKRQVIERATHCAVLDADDPSCLAMAAHARARRVVLVSQRPGSAAVRTHCAAGGAAVILDSEGAEAAIVLVDERGRRRRVATAAEIPLTYAGTARHNVRNAQHATALAWGLGVPLDTVAAALRTVTPTEGRLCEIGGFTFRVIVDAAHNAHGMRELVAFVDRQPCAGRRIVVAGGGPALGVAAYRAAAAVLVGHFDHYVAKNFHAGVLGDLAPTEMPDGLVEEWRQRGVPPARTASFVDHLEALRHALGLAAPGDLLVVTVSPGYHDREETLAWLENEGRRRGGAGPNDGRDGSTKPRSS